MAGKYQSYPVYKPSGVEWLGDIPEGWELLQSRRMFSQRKERARPDDEQLTASQKYGIIYQKEFMEIENQRVVQVITGSEILKHVEPNDFVISMRSFQGGLEWCKYAGCVSSAYVGVVPQKHVVPAFFSYFFKCRQYIQALQSTSNLVRDGQALRFDNFAQVPLPIVPEHEQSKIAAFLDHETAKIDGLIAKQQRLIALLEEKRQAVISHAVTKGLDPTAPLHPSGIDWLGDVPAHWEIKKVAWGFKATKGKNGQLLTKEYCGENSGPYPVYSGQTENEGVLGRISWYEFDFGSDGTLFATTVGAKAMNLSHLFGKLSLSQNCMLITSVGPDLLTRFFFYHFQPLFRFERSLIPDHMQASFRMEDLYQYHHAVPPVSEQRDIASFLDVETDKFADLISKAQSAITLLKERRTALISAAVTGKIDLRDWQPPEGASGISTQDIDQTEEALA